jgi:4-amino-4-deoxy-L-arabinose transferase-like glycosyltransferase
VGPVEKRSPAIESAAGQGAIPVFAGTVVLVGIAMIVRGLLLGSFPLCDNTESRYATIGMHMHLSGDWLTPRLWYQGEFVPFWGKPPMHFWLTAASYKLFGLSEWASRVPGWLGGLVMLGSSFLLAAGFGGGAAGAWAMFLLASSALFYVLAGSCTTDITMSAFLAVAMLSFARSTAAEPGRKRVAWGLALFVSMAGAVLTKGPVALVLTGLALFAYAAISRRWRDFKNLPWLIGAPLFFLITVPWFVWAERATPGFLRYYFVNEHFLRYVRHDYGDLYGVGHDRPFGTIWVFLLLGFLPWTAALAWGCFGETVRRVRARDHRIIYALCWGLAPAVFFTPARQILATYLLPGIPGLAVAGALIVAGSDRFRRRGTLLMAVGAFAFVAIPIGALVYRPWAEDRECAKGAVRMALADPRLADLPLVFPFDEVHSAEFYTRLWAGRDIEHYQAGGGRVLEQKLAEGARAAFVFRRSSWDKLAPAMRERLEVTGETPGWVLCLPHAAR